MRPFYCYDNWSTYDELSDAVPLTEELALYELEQIVRLKKAGVAFDGYLMDAFWYDPAEEYKRWRKDRWPDGPQRWLDGCHKNELKPGLWFPANTAFHIEPPKTWKDSLSSDGWGFCCFEGGFMEGFSEVLRDWYKLGVRVYKFDFADFSAATESTRLKMLPSEIRTANVEAYRKALSTFKHDCPEALLCAYNGFEEAEFMTWTDRPVRRTVDPKWLDTFDTIYSGDPRPADLPLPNFWRTLDVYADHMVWYLQQGGLKGEQIDNCAFMIGQTGTCYRRGKAGWKSSLLLSLARGGKIHMCLGNLENLTDEDAAFYAGAQQLYENAGTPKIEGGIPGNGDIYGYRADGLVTLVNPSLSEQSLAVDAEHILYAEGSVELQTGRVHLSGGGMAILALGNFHPIPILENSATDQGYQGLEEIPVDWHLTEREASGKFVLEGSDAHLVMRQFDSKGRCVRTSGGAPPNGRRSPELLTIRAKQDGRELCVYRPDDEIIWSGISWSYGILKGLSLGKPVEVLMGTSDSAVKRIEVKAYVASLKTL